MKVSNEKVLQKREQITQEDMARNPGMLQQK